jgi:hypothetical protein
MTPAQIKEREERIFRIVVIMLVTPVIGVVSYLLLLKKPMHDKNSHKKKNVPPMSVAEKINRVITALGWILSSVIGWALCLMFSSAFSSLIPYPITDQTTIPARFLFMAIWVPITFVLWTIVWHIAYYILDRAEHIDKKKRVLHQS